LSSVKLEKKQPVKRERKSSTSLAAAAAATAAAARALVDERLATVLAWVHASSTHERAS